MGEYWNEAEDEAKLSWRWSQNPNIVPSSLSPENHNIFAANRLSQNPRALLENHQTSQNQNPLTENIYFQKPLHPGGYFGQDPMNQPEQSLEAKLRLLNLSTPPHHRSRFLQAPPATLGNAGGGSMLGNICNNNSMMGGGISLSSYHEQYSQKLRYHKQCLQTRRIQSAVRGQRGGDDMSNTFGLFYPPYSSSTSFARNYPNGDAASSSYGSSVAMSSTSYDYPIRLSSRKGNQQDYNFQRSHNAPMAKDDHGHHQCRSSNKFEVGMPGETDETDRLYNSMLYDDCDCELLEICDESDQNKITQILFSLIANERKFKRICTDSNGSRSMQKLLDYLKTPEQMALLIPALRKLTHILTKCSGGQFLLARCFCLFPEELNKHLLNEVVENCVDIATDKVGCCTLYKCIDYAGGEVKQRLVAKIAANALFLAIHPYGNFVVQHILGLRMPHVLADVVARLEGSFLALSMDKSGSHVVEKCMREFGEEHSTRIIQELISSPSILFLNFLQDKFGNYVAQSALTISKGAIHHALVRHIEHHSKDLENHPCGKMVLARARGGNKHRG